MAISRSSAARLCTKPELELVDASAPARLRELTPGRLRQKVERARRLRDKYRDLAKRQRLEARGKRDAQRSRPARGNENTTRKAELFQEVLDRFEAQLARTGGPKEGGAKRAGAKKAGAAKAGGKKAGAKKTGAKKAAGRRAGAGKAAARRTGAGKTGTQEAAASGGPARGEARPAPPARPGAAALKGARQRASMEDGKVVGRRKTLQSHTKAANRRRQVSRDRRGAE
jgi:hypothetical protein